MRLKNTHIIIFLLVFLGFLSSSSFAFEACFVVQDEDVVHRKTIFSKKESRECSQGNRKDIETATTITKAFWSAKENHLSFFSDRNKKVLEADYLTFNDVHKYLFYYERIWTNQKYTTAFHQNDKSIQLIVLSTWSQEGYVGTTTFTFDLVYEKGKWVIDLMIY